MPIGETLEAMFRGDGRDYEITVKDGDGVVVNITGAKLWFTVKDDYSKSDANAEFQLTSDDAAQINITDATNGKARIFIKNAHTKDLISRDYFFDVQIKEVSREPRTVISGLLKIKWDTTIDIV